MTFLNRMLNPMARFLGWAIVFSALPVLFTGPNRNSPFGHVFASPNLATLQERPEKPSNAAKPPAPQQELQQVVSAAGSDRAALVRGLEAYLKKYPDSPQRPQIYRALVEASLQLRDDARAMDYAERAVTLAPDDMSLELLAIQLLDRHGDGAAMARAITYASRVLEYVQRSALDEKSPRVSAQEWEQQKARDASYVLLLRGGLHFKRKEMPLAQSDLEQSYALVPGAAAAEKLGELAELQKDSTRAVTQYARAFVLAEPSGGAPSRLDIRRKLGNVWRLSHGNEDGLGDFLLTTYDEIAAANVHPARRNSDERDVFDLQLRRAPDGTPLAMKDLRGRVVVLNFWTTWCGPCRALKPAYERVAQYFQGRSDVAFLEANCDEDESLVPPYLAEEKPRVPVLFADGLERLFAVNSFPTVIVLDREGKIAYRSEGFGDEKFEEQLTAAVTRATTGSNETQK
jgi:thiol-disulfide isomerase/thioredoxin